MTRLSVRKGSFVRRLACILNLDGCGKQESWSFDLRRYFVFNQLKRALNGIASERSPRF